MDLLYTLLTHFNDGEPTYFYIAPKFMQVVAHCPWTVLLIMYCKLSRLKYSVDSINDNLYRCLGTVQYFN